MMHHDKRLPTRRATPTHQISDTTGLPSGALCWNQKVRHPVQNDRLFTPHSSVTCFWTYSICLLPCKFERSNLPRLVVHLLSSTSRLPPPVFHLLSSISCLSPLVFHLLSSTPCYLFSPTSCLLPLVFHLLLPLVSHLLSSTSCLPPSELYASDMQIRISSTNHKFRYHHRGI